MESYEELHPYQGQGAKAAMLGAVAGTVFGISLLTGLFGYGNHALAIALTAVPLLIFMPATALAWSVVGLGVIGVGVMASMAFTALFVGNLWTQMVLSIIAPAG